MLIFAASKIHPGGTKKDIAADISGIFCAKEVEKRKIPYCTAWAFLGTCESTQRFPPG
jgi:hypothetical protein